MCKLEDDISFLKLHDEHQGISLNTRPSHLLKLVIVLSYLAAESKWLLACKLLTIHSSGADAQQCKQYILNAPVWL